ncbi:Uncharacterized protein Adt_19345 [Abeliophyllum distichum]|uniref:Uncharacterized protein n=1 Tax=Abeliophyllum distichum TaxID=126358 RepID=A0ABD1SV30_9LAMI
MTTRMWALKQPSFEESVIAHWSSSMAPKMYQSSRGCAVGGGSGEVELRFFQGCDEECRVVGVVEHVEDCGGNGDKEDNSNEEDNGPKACEAEAAALTEVVAVGRWGLDGMGGAWGYKDGFWLLLDWLSLRLLQGLQWPPLA